MLPDELLLETFDFCVCGADGKRRWVTLVHVCRRWRSIVFGSPHRLDLQIVCTARTPVREMLHIWPAFPIAVRISDQYEEIFDNVVAALEHTDRVCEIYANALSGDELDELTTVLHNSFPALTHLHLGTYEYDEVAIVPKSFLGGSAPLLRSLYLMMNFEYPSPLPQLLSSATGLVSLSLFDRSFISSKMMVDCLTSLTRLEKLQIEYQSWLPYESHPRPSRHPRPLTQPTDLRLLPVLATFAFVGSTDYFDDLFTHIDAPQLEDIKIEFTNPTILNSSRILLLTSLKESFKALDQAHIVIKEDGLVNVTLSSRRGTTSGTMLELLISHGIYESDWAFWELNRDPHRLSSPIPANFERLAAREVNFAEFDVRNDQWLELFRFLSAVGNMYLSEALAMCLSPALRELVGERATEVLPALENLYIENLQPSGLIKEAIGEFAAARELSGHPITVQSWTEEIRECVRRELDD